MLARRYAGKALQSTELVFPSDGAILRATFNPSSNLFCQTDQTDQFPTHILSSYLAFPIVSDQVDIHFADSTSSADSPSWLLIKKKGPVFNFSAYETSAYTIWV